MTTTTQHEFIVWYLLKYKTISPAEAFYADGISKLATRISEMRDLGFSFGQAMETDKNRHGRPVHYMRYWLDEEHCDDDALLIVEKMRERMGAHE